jgi:hypothetical protein
MNHPNGTARSNLTLNTHPDAMRILADVCKRFRVPRSQLMGRDRHWVVCWPRFIAIALIHEVVPANQASMAALFQVSQQAICNALGAVRELEEVSAHARSDMGIMRMRLGINLENQIAKFVGEAATPTEGVKKADTPPKRNLFSEKNRPVVSSPFDGKTDQLS